MNFAAKCQVISPSVIVAIAILAGTRQIPAAAQSATTEPTSAPLTDSGDRAIGAGKIVALDYYCNHQMRNGTQAGYIWENTENDGYSDFGEIWKRAGATLARMEQAPSRKDLDRYSVYIIVSPSNQPASRGHPASRINSTAVDTIVSWVQDGGVIALFGNSKGKCDFDGLNALSRYFGILFNNDLSSTFPKPGDSTVEYDGKQMATKPETIRFMGFPTRLDGLPDHEIFRGVKSVEIREFSTLTVSNEEHYSLLRESHDYTFKTPTRGQVSDVILDGVGRVETVMATFRLGKGTAFAVGCPWLDNATLDLQTPQGSDNRRMASNLVRWLLKHCTELRAGG
ncbi:MAG: hypothetical protein ABSH22_17150 [Tepidisphaeraceae bacterium]|jgi:unsaturated rhamnogalacturonyl hydrolase